MENCNRTRVRKYRKSSVPRLQWTPELHDHFVEAVQKLGGKYKATPKRIMQVMAVRGLEISHIKSHLQMYRSMKESIDSKVFVPINNYQEKKSDWTTSYQLHPQQVSQGLREAPNHGKQVKRPFICQGRRKIAQNAQNLSYHKYQGKTGSTGSGITNNDGEIENLGRANVELAEDNNVINLWSLTNHKTSESSGDGPINLDLTMS